MPTQTFTDPQTFSIVPAGAPDVVAEVLGCSLFFPAQVATDYSVPFQVTNQGTADAPSGTVEITLTAGDQSFVRVIGFPPLSPGQSQTINAILNVPIPGYEAPGSCSATIRVVTQ